MTLEQIVTNELREYIDTSFKNYEASAHNDSEWSCAMASNRLAGVLMTLQTVTGADTVDVVEFMKSCTSVEYRPRPFL